MGMQAEVLQNWADALLALCRTLPDAELTRDVEQTFSSMAKALFKQAVEAYQQVEPLTFSPCCPNLCHRCM